MSVKGLIFDFDYTLADSSKGAVECINYALQELGLKKRSEKEICKTIGMSLSNTFISLSGLQDPDLIEEFRKNFIKRADQVMADLTVIFEDVPETLEYLHSKEVKMAIVSTKFRYRIETILQRENLLDVFDVIIGGEDVSKNKPDPEGIIKAFEKIELPGEQCIYIGDSLVDAETARAADLAFVAVLSGETTREDFEKADVTGIINKFSDLIRIVF
ncbi:MAG: HAD family hydrolase [Deltaproteobacteria bacterium]